MRATTQGKRGQDLMVARLLFVYKTEYPDPDECIAKLASLIYDTT
jgi:hypothetical protein